MSGKKGDHFAPPLPGMYSDRFKRSTLGWPEFYQQQLLSESDRKTLLFDLAKQDDYAAMPEKFDHSLEILSFGSDKQILITYLDALYANPDMRQIELVDNWFATQSLASIALGKGADTKLDLKNSPIVKPLQTMSKSGVRAEFIKEEYINWLREFLRDPSIDGSDIAAELARVFQMVARQGLPGIARALADKSSPFFMIIRALHDAAQTKMHQFSTNDAYTGDIMAFSLASALMTVEQRSAFCEYYNYITPEQGKSELQTLIVAESQRINEYANSAFTAFTHQHKDAKLFALINMLLTNYQLLHDSREQIQAVNKNMILECAVCVEQIQWLKGQVEKALYQGQTLAPKDVADLAQVDFNAKTFNFAEGHAFFRALIKKLTLTPDAGTGLRLEV